MAAVDNFNKSAVDELVLVISGADDLLDGLDEGASGPDVPPKKTQLEVAKLRQRELEEEIAKLKQSQMEMGKQRSTGRPPSSLATRVNMSIQEKTDADNRSIFVGNVDYSATVALLEEHFYGCGAINRITIPRDKFSSKPKGFAYIEFADKDSVQVATALDESLFRGRQIKVVAKRTNRPGISTTNRQPTGHLLRSAHTSGYAAGGVYGSRRPSLSLRPQGASWYSPYGRTFTAKKS